MSVIAAVILTTLYLFSPLAIAQLKAPVESSLPTGTLAMVNNRPIFASTVEGVALQLAGNGEPADLAQILDELINLELLTQRAEAQKLDKQPEVSAALQLQYTQTMANAYLAQKGAEITFSDEQLREEYAIQSASVKRSEFRASHILLETEQDAQNVLAELAAGQNFVSLAKTHSVDPTNENGGDIGWVQTPALPAKFAEEISTMEVGDISKAPVKTEYGYHIIELTDKRNTALPDFESVKDDLTNLAVRKALAAHVEELRSAATIDR